MWTLLCSLATASPVVLRPDPTVEAWGTATHDIVQHMPGGLPQHQAPLLIHSGSRPLDADTFELIVMSPTPLPQLSWLHPELAIVHQVTVDAAGSPTAIVATHDDLGPLLRGIVAPALPPIDPEAVVRGSCGPLLFLTLLPAHPVAAGDAWSVADADCTFEPPQVRCDVASRWSEPSVTYDLEATVTLDLAEGGVDRCERQYSLSRIVTTAQGPLPYRTDITEFYQHAPPRSVGWTLLTKGLVATAGGLCLGLLALWRYRR